MGQRWLVIAVWMLLGAAACSASETGNGSGSTGNGANGSGTAGGGVFANAPSPTGTAGGAGVAGSAVPAGPASGACAEGVANTAPVTPTVWLVLDGSGSMNEDFSGETRWQALRAALMDPGGVVATLAPNVRFGMVLYSGADEGEDGAAPAECVELVIVDPALDNYAAIAAQFPQEELGGWTPTDRALEHVVNELPVTNAQVLDADPAPTYVVLATDGAPNDRCGGDASGGGGGRGGQSSGLDPEVAQRVIDVVGRGAQAGVELLVISLAGGDDELKAHLEEVTQVSGTGQAPFVPATRDELVTTLQEIIGGASCQITLDGSVMPGQDCAGHVTLNGAPLACNDANGFRLLDERTVQLSGEACNGFLATNSQVLASFPCNAFTPD